MAADYTLTVDIINVIVQIIIALIAIISLYIGILNKRKMKKLENERILPTLDFQYKIIKIESKNYFLIEFRIKNVRKLNIIIKKFEIEFNSHNLNAIDIESTKITPENLGFKCENNKIFYIIEQFLEKDFFNSHNVYYLKGIQISSDNSVLLTFQIPIKEIPVILPCKITLSASYYSKKSTKEIKQFKIRQDNKIIEKIKKEIRNLKTFEDIWELKFILNKDS